MNEDLVKRLSEEISAEEYFLSGLKLYYRLIPAAIRWTNSGSIKRISARMNAAINQAKLLVNKHENGADVGQEIIGFKWPEKWGPMASRVLAVQTARMASGVYEDDPDKISKEDLKKIKARVSDFL